MATAIQGVAPRTARPTTREAFPPGSLRFDWINTVLGALWLIGIFIDGWAHNHDKVDNTFFTPWHAILYSMFGVFGIFLTLTLTRNLTRGYMLTRALPRGYSLSMLGILIFAFAGVFDFAWHSLFGFEIDTEALLSPAHLLLALGFVLVMTGPVRSLVARIPAHSSPNWREFGPLTASLTFTFALFAFFTQFTHPFVYEIAAMKGGNSNIYQSLGVSAILIQSALTMGLVLWAVRRWRLPFGALTLFIAVPSAMVTVFQDRMALIPGAIAAGLIAEMLYLWLKPTADRMGRFVLFGLLVPIAVYSLYFLTVQLTYRLGWSIHLWAGSIVMAATVGLMLAFMLAWPHSDTQSTA